MSILLDKLLTREQLAQCRAQDAADADIPEEALDAWLTRTMDAWPPRRVECAEEGHVEPVSYDVGRIQAESKREARGFWWAMPVIVALSILAAWLQYGAPL